MFDNDALDMQQNSLEAHWIDISIIALHADLTPVATPVALILCAVQIIRHPKTSVSLMLSHSTLNVLRCD